MRALLAQEKNKTLLAQEPEKKGDIVYANFSEIVELVAGISDTYYREIEERKKTGVLKLSAPQVGQLKYRIHGLIEDLQKFEGDKPLKQPDFTGENKAALVVALLCSNCSGKIPSGGQVEALVSQNQLRNLLLARCITILQLLPQDDKSEVLQSGLFSLELHFSYLRQISIAFDAT
jgi:hypothetical protein